MSAHWAAWLAFAIRQLGLAPESFWTLSLAEWRVLTAPPSGAAPMTRAQLSALLAQYPDIAAKGVPK